MFSSILRALEDVSTYPRLKTTGVENKDILGGGEWMFAVVEVLSR
jgi:hypothetical protein